MKVEKIKNTHAFPFEIEKKIRKYKKEEFYGFFSHGNDIYIIISLGQKNTSGYEVNIRSIVEVDLEVWEIRMQKIEPKKEQVLAQVITTPLIIVKIAIIDKIIPNKIIFKDNKGKVIKGINLNKQQ